MRKTSVQPTRGKFFIVKVEFAHRGETLDVSNHEARGPLTPLAAAINFRRLRGEFGGKFLRRFFQKATAVKGA